MLTLNNTIKNYRHRSTGSGASHISQFGNWVLEHMDSHQIWYLGLYTNSKEHHQKLSSSVHRVRYLPYKSNRYTVVLSTWNVRFTPNLIFSLVCQLLITLPKIITNYKRDYQKLSWLNHRVRYLPSK